MRHRILNRGRAPPAALQPPQIRLEILNPDPLPSQEQTG